MRAPRPTEQIRAGHLPADLYDRLPAGTDVHRLVVVAEQPRPYLGTVLVILAATVGVIGVIVVATVAVMQLASIAATTAAAIATAIPALIGGGSLISIALGGGGRK